MYLMQNWQAHSHSMLLVHNERFEILVVELVQLGDHVAVAEIRVLIYSHNEQSWKCVDDNNTVQALYNEAALEFGNSIYGLFSA